MEYEIIGEGVKLTVEFLSEFPFRRRRYNRGYDKICNKVTFGILYINGVKKEQVSIAKHFKDEDNESLAIKICAKKLFDQAGMPKIIKKRFWNLILSGKKNEEPQA